MDQRLIDLREKLTGLITGVKDGLSDQTRVLVILVHSDDVRSTVTLGDLPLVLAREALEHAEGHGKLWPGATRQ